MTDDDSRTKLVDADPLEDPDGGFGERTLDVLLTDYAAAAEDGRYRDRFLHYTYYLAVVLVGLILSASEMLLAVADGRPFVLVLSVWWVCSPLVHCRTGRRAFVRLETQRGRDVPRSRSIYVVSSPG